MADSKCKIAFAGLGAMGFGMASHLLRSGFSVVGYDVYAPAMERFAAEGGASAPSPREAVKGSEFLVCMVANSIQSTPLILDESQGAALGLPPNATIIMCATVSPAYINWLRRRLDEVRPDICLIDSPVSGGAARAADGTLSIFASGEEAHLSKVHFLLESLSSKLYHIEGGLGGGSKAKLIHQIFAGVHIAMASEAMGLAALAGLNTREAFDTLKSGDGNSWMFSNRVPHMLKPSSPYSAINIIAKDVAIITSTSREMKFPLPLLSAAEQLYMAGISSSWGKEDDCVMVRLYLPGRPTLVSQQVEATPEAKPGPFAISDIEDLLIGVHLAVMSEAMTFCERLGIDVELMFDIVSNAAGSSAIFVKTFGDLRTGGWSLKAVHDVERIQNRLSAAIDKAFQFRYPLFLSSAALTEFHRQLV